MSMSTDACGFRPPDEKWKKMKAIYDACEVANEEIPESVNKFFNYEPPDENGIKVEFYGHPCCLEYHGDCGSGLEIDISKLPKNITKIRFTNSW